MLYSTGHLMNDLRKFSSQIVNKNVKNLKTGPSVVVVLTTIWLTHTHTKTSTVRNGRLTRNGPSSIRWQLQVPFQFISLFFFCLERERQGNDIIKPQKKRCLIWPLWTWTVATSSSLNCYNELLFSAHLGFLLAGDLKHSSSFAKLFWQSYWPKEKLD